MKRNKHILRTLLAVTLCVLLSPVHGFAEGASMEVEPVLPIQQEEATLSPDSDSPPVESMPSETPDSSEEVSSLPADEAGEEVQEELPPEPAIDFVPNEAQTQEEGTEPVEGIASLLLLDTFTADKGMNVPRRKHQIVTLDNVMYAIGGQNNADGKDANTIEKYDIYTNTWEIITTIPSMRQGMKAVAYEDTILLIGGYENGVYSSQVDAYSISENTWTSKKQMKMRRERCAATVVDGYVYVMGGRNDNGLLDSIEKYDIYRDTWTPESRMPVRMMDGALFYLEGNLYLTMGFDAQGYSQRMYEYRLQTKRWIEKTGIGLNVTDSKAAMQYSSFGIHEANQLYVLTNTASGQKILSSYNIDTDVWTQKEVITDAISYYDIGIIGDKLYVTGGQQGGFSTNQVTVYDIENTILPDTWQTQNPMLAQRFKLQSAVVDGTLYTIGKGEYEGRIEVYNDKTCLWKTLGNLPNIRDGYTLFAGGDQKLYAVGGYKNGKWLREVNIYQPSTGKWTQTQMKHGRERAAVVQSGNELYVIGGRNEYGIVASIECYDMTTGTWTEKTPTDKGVLRIDAQATCVDKTLYMAGGHDGMGYQNAVAAYDMADFSKLEEKPLGASYEEFQMTAAKDTLILFARSNGAFKYDTYEYDLGQQMLRQTNIADSIENIRYAELAVYGGYLYLLGGYDMLANTNVDNVYRYTVYYSNAQVPEVNAPEGNTASKLRLPVQEGEEYEFYVKVTDLPSYDGCTFTVSYLPNTFTVSDLCTMTPPRDTQIGMIPNTNIEVLSVSDEKIQFKIHDTIPEGEVCTGVVNVIRLRAQTTGSVQLGYQMDWQ